MPVFLLLTCIPIELAPLVNVVKKNKNAIRIPLNYLFFATPTRQIFLPFRLIKIEAPVITILINCLPDYHPTDSSKKQLSNRFPISPPLLSDTRIIRGWFRGTRLTETRGATKRGREGRQRKAHRPRGSQPEDQRRNGGVYNTGGGGGRLRRSPLEGL